MENNIAEIRLSYRNSKKKAIKITSSRTAYEILISNWDKDLIELQEEFKAIFLNRANIVIGIYHLSKGSSSGTLVDIKLLLCAAIKCNASGLILAHNHPSGALKASEPDIKITKKIKEAANLFEIVTLDHFIITKGGFFSFSENGIM